MANPDINNDAFVGEIRMFSFSELPPGWLPCDGRMTYIAHYTALHAQIGTTYGGDGTLTFALPNLCGRVMRGGVDDLGKMGGSEGVVLVKDNMPSHSHLMNCSMSSAIYASPDLGLPATVTRPTASTPTAEPYLYRSAKNPTMCAMDPDLISAEGQSEAHENRQPYLVLTFGICYNGISPTF